MFRKRNISVINISKILRNMDNRPFHAVWRVHCQDGQLSQDFFPQSLREQVCDSIENMRWIQKIYNHSIWLRFRNSIWFLSSIPEVKNFIGAVEDEGRKKLVRKDEKNVIIVIIIIKWIQVMEIMDEFCDTVLPVVNQLEQVWMSNLRSEILRDC